MLARSHDWEVASPGSELPLPTSTWILALIYGSRFCFSHKVHSRGSHVFSESFLMKVGGTALS